MQAVGLVVVMMLVLCIADTLVYIEIEEPGAQQTRCVLERLDNDFQIISVLLNATESVSMILSSMEAHFVIRLNCSQARVFPTTPIDLAHPSNPIDFLKFSVVPLPILLIEKPSISQESQCSCSNLLPPLVQHTDTDSNKKNEKDDCRKGIHSSNSKRRFDLALDVGIILNIVLIVMVAARSLLHGDSRFHINQFLS
jgi:hypothetical protein